nr:hypothetical protein BdHM001_35660 [Bdellovibrio sp. HM001]
MTSTTATNSAIGKLIGAILTLIGRVVFTKHGIMTIGTMVLFSLASSYLYPFVVVALALAALALTPGIYVLPVVATVVMFKFLSFELIGVGQPLATFYVAHPMMSTLEYWIYSGPFIFASVVSYFAFHLIYKTKNSDAGQKIADGLRVWAIIAVAMMQVYSVYNLRGLRSELPEVTKKGAVYAKAGKYEKNLSKWSSTDKRLVQKHLKVTKDILVGFSGVAALSGIAAAVALAAFRRKDWSIDLAKVVSRKSVIVLKAVGGNISVPVNKHTLGARHCDNFEYASGEMLSQIYKGSYHLTSDLKKWGRLKKIQGFDQGVDVLVYGQSLIDREPTTAVVQAKYYSKPVGVEAIDQLVRGYHVYRQEGIVKTSKAELVLITNNTLTPAAEQAAKAQGIIVFSGQKTVACMRDFKVGEGTRAS